MPVLIIQNEDDDRCCAGLVYFEVLAGILVR
jgi:hypothetical protein